MNTKKLKQNFFFYDFPHQSTMVPDIIVLRIMSRRAGVRRTSRDVHDSVSGWKLRRPLQEGKTCWKNRDTKG